MDLSYFEQITDTVPDADIAQAEEKDTLAQVAKYIPLLKWEYDPTKVNEKEGVHIGFITQALKKVEGLDSAVSTDENGIETFDSRYVAAAALSLVAALARQVLNIQLEKNYGDE